MSGDAVAKAAAAPSILDRARRWFIVAGGLLLVGGVVVFVLGRGAASDASDDLDRARRQLHRQEEVTRAARECASNLESLRPAVVDAGRHLLDVAEQITVQDEAIVTATRDQQEAGVAGGIDSYNNAVSRVNAAADAGNALLDEAGSAQLALDEAERDLRSGC